MLTCVCTLHHRNCESSRLHIALTRRWSQSFGRCRGGWKLGFAPPCSSRRPPTEGSVSSAAQCCTGMSIFTTDPGEWRGSRDKRQISSAVASELVLVEDYYGRPQRYCQTTGLTSKCSPNKQEAERSGPIRRAGLFGLRPSKVPLNLVFFTGDQAWAEFTAGCMNVSTGCLRLFITVYSEPNLSSTCGTVPSDRKCCISGTLIAARMPAAKKWLSSSIDHDGLNMESKQMHENLSRSGKFVLQF